MDYVVDGLKHSKRKIQEESVMCAMVAKEYFFHTPSNFQPAVHAEMLSHSAIFLLP
jgi:hypothetical protein